MAVQSGASEVWVAVDALLGDTTALLSELVTLREACPLPVRLGLILPVDPALSYEDLARSAEQAGYQCLVVSDDDTLPELNTQLPIERL